MTSTFVLGKGTKLRISMLPEGGTTKPVAATVTTAASLTAKDITAPAAITVTALGSGVFIPAGSYLGFKAPTTGKIVVVQLAADADTGDTSLNVTSIPEDIAASSVATYPLVLSGRTAANIGRTGNRVSSVDFDSDAYASGLTTSIEQTMELPGNFLPTDAGFLTAEYAFTNLREVWIEVELPRPSVAFTKGRIYEGRGSITDLPLEIPADGIITGSISLAFNGKPNTIDPEPTPIA